MHTIIIAADTIYSPRKPVCETTKPKINGPIPMPASKIAKKVAVANPTW